jgi:hypothetical protein
MWGLGKRGPIKIRDTGSLEISSFVKINGTGGERGKERVDIEFVCM